MQLQLETNHILLGISCMPQTLIHKIGQYIAPDIETEFIFVFIWDVKEVLAANHKAASAIYQLYLSMVQA